MSSWLWLGSAFGVVAFVRFLVFPLPPLPIQGSRGPSSIVFLWRVLDLGSGVAGGLVAGLRVGQAYGVFHPPGFGLLVSVPRSLSTQPPFATQALITCLKNSCALVLNHQKSVNHGEINYCGVVVCCCCCIFLITAYCATQTWRTIDRLLLQNYNTDHCCYFKFLLRPNSTIHLDLKMFATECNWDHLYIYDGNSVKSPLIAVLRWE